MPCRARIEKRRDGDVFVGRRLDRAVAIGQRLGIPDRTRRRVAAGDLHAIQISDISRVVLHLERQRLQCGQIGRIESDSRIERRAAGGLDCVLNSRLDVGLGGGGDWGFRGAAVASEGGARDGQAAVGRITDEVEARTEARQAARSGSLRRKQLHFRSARILEKDEAERVAPRGEERRSGERVSRSLQAVAVHRRTAD